MVLKMVMMMFACLALVSCTSNIPLEKQCSVDSDCVPAVCCHADDAVNGQYAPDCSDVLCSQSCEPDTLDCGQGEIRCIDNTCTAVILR